MIAFVLFAPIRAHWDKALGMMGPLRTLEWRDVEFDRDAPWREFVHDLYPTHSRKRIERKCDDLAPYPRALRIVAAEGDQAAVQAVKDKIRREFAAIAPVENFITVHSSDTDAEARMFWAMTHPVNLEHARRRPRASQGFLARTARAKRELARCGIPVEETCVVSGMVLDACGIREAGDIDLLVPKQYRDVEFVGVDRAGTNYLRRPRDAAIIHDPRYHFWADGLKFAALDLVAAKKARGERVKDREDLELIRAAR